MALTIVGSALAYVALFLVDGPSLIRRHRWREFSVYLVVYLMTAALGFYWTIARPPVPLNQYVMKALEPVANLIFGPPGGP